VEEGKLIFAYESKPITPEKVDLIKNLRQDFSNIHENILVHCPKSREQSIALTHLETAAMFAIKAITHEVVKD
jgi:hypothetical protein